MDDERNAVRRCQAGESAAFEPIVRCYGDLLFGTALLMLRDRGAAEDAVQDAFVAAWRGIGTFDAGRPLRPWLVRVLVNEVLQRQRRRRVPVEPASEERLASLISVEPGPEQTAERAWERTEMAAALASLPSDVASVIVLRYFSELSLAEVGEALRIPEGTVKSRLHRALRSLRDALEGSELAPHRGESEPHP